MESAYRKAKTKLRAQTGTTETLRMRVEEAEQRRVMLELAQRESKELTAMRIEEVHSRCVHVTLKLRDTMTKLLDSESERDVLKHELQLANDRALSKLHVESATIIQGYWRGYVWRDSAAMTAQDKMRALDAIITIGMAGSAKQHQEELVKLDSIEDENERRSACRWRHPVQLAKVVG